ncbi:MAG: sulfatase-like hydrolase/transferase [Candidatus Omnitrophota bacterium]
MNKPNVIVLTVDMVRNDMLGKFPAFRKLKEKGVLFSHMITYAPYTIASLHAIFTGMYGRDTNVDAYFKPVKFDKDHCYTLTQYLKKDGYYTEADVMAELTIPRYGFDKFTVHDEHKDNLLERHEGVIERAMRQQERFFLYLHYSNIHTEIVKNVIRRYTDFDAGYFGKIDENRAQYETYVQKACDYVEGVIELFDRHNLWENTLFIVLSDHGCGIGEKPGEKAYGVYTYDYSIKVFSFFIYPKFLPQNKEVGIQVRSVDIMPTVLDILGIEPDNAYKQMRGASLMEMIRDRDSTDRIAFAETGGLEGPYPSPYQPNVKCIRSRKWKLIYNSTTGAKELYDLENDPGEKDNCIDKYPEPASELWSELSKNI